MGNDGNPVPQDVCFIHMVCGENNGAACQAQTQGRGTSEAYWFSTTELMELQTDQQGPLRQKNLEACVAKPPSQKSEQEHSSGNLPHTRQGAG